MPGRTLLVDDGSAYHSLSHMLVFWLSFVRISLELEIEFDSLESMTIDVDCKIHFVLRTTVNDSGLRYVFFIV